MIKKIIVFVLLIAVISIAAFLDRTQIEDLYGQFFGILPKIENVVQDKTQEIKKEVNTPPPLQAKEEAPQAFLTNEGVIKFTNLERQKNGLPALSENSLLDESAQKKVKDMFAKQYFEHVSPTGVDVSNLAEGVGYNYIVIGENLALGNFLNDEALVEAWMNSPGHRANILNSKYKEIGVAVLKGTYQGKTTWMAVQHFAKPLSDCPQVDMSLSQKITDDNNHLDQISKDLNTRRVKLDQMRTSRDPQYNQKADEYNKLVGDYNSLVEETKRLIEDYNNEVKNFNQCAS